jgi:hypothetical protein
MSMCKDEWDDRLPVCVDLRDNEAKELVEALDGLYQAYGGHGLRVEDVGGLVGRPLEPKAHAEFMKPSSLGAMWVWSKSRLLRRAAAMTAVQMVVEGDDRYTASRRVRHEGGGEETGGRTWRECRGREHRHRERDNCEDAETGHGPPVTGRRWLRAGPQARLRWHGSCPRGGRRGGLGAGGTAPAVGRLKASSVGAYTVAARGCWQDDYQCMPDGSVVCRLRCRIGGAWLTKVVPRLPAALATGLDKARRTWRRPTRYTPVTARRE